MTTFSIVTKISIVFTLTIAALSIIGISITGLYPALIVILLAALIPVASRLYSAKITDKPIGFRKRYYRTFTFINILIIFLFIYMTFVILVDRVFPVIL